jgi:hypothetical protein
MMISKEENGYKFELFYKACILKWIGMYPIESQLNSWDFMMRKYNNLSMKEKYFICSFFMFRSTARELLNIEQFCHWIFNKINIETFYKNGAGYLLHIIRESPQWVGFNGHFFWPKVWEILKFWVTFFFYWKLNRNSKFNF